MYGSNLGTKIIVIINKLIPISKKTLRLKEKSFCSTEFFNRKIDNNKIRNKISKLQRFSFSNKEVKLSNDQN